MIYLIAIFFVLYGVYRAAAHVCLRVAMTRFGNAVALECDRHHQALCLNYKRLVSIDEYGSFVFDRMITHLIVFINRNVVTPSDAWTQKYINQDVVRHAAYVALDRLLSVHMPAYEDSLIDAAVSEPPSHHGDFERWCADNMAARGWQTRVTGKTGDQGADIVATKDGETLVVQCKRYSAPVGNKAVQEIVGAIAYYNADRGAVISTSGFTAAAQSLARVNGVLLIDAVSLAEHNESSIFN